AVAQHTGLAYVNDPGRQQMQDERLVADLDRMSRVVTALIADHDIETLSEQIDNLAFAFIAPLGADNRDHHNQKSEVRGQRSEVSLPREISASLFAFTRKAVSHGVNTRRARLHQQSRTAPTTDFASSSCGGADVFVQH